IHCTSATVACRSRCNTGSATLTTVPSIKAILDPRIVAARIQAPLFLFVLEEVTGDGAGAEWMTPESHGGLSMLAIGCLLVFRRTSPIRANYNDELTMNRPPKLGEDCLHRPPDAAAIAPT